VVLRKKHSKLCADKVFTEEYRVKLYRLTKKYFNTYSRLDRAGKVDGQTYAWLTMKVHEMQYMLGHLGLVDYKPAYQNNYLRDYKVVVNTLPKFRDNSITANEANHVDDCILRYLGNLELNTKTFHSKYRNPLECAKYGLRWILSKPIEFLGGFGIVSDAKVKQYVGSQLFKGVHGLVWLAGAVVTMVEIFRLLISYWPQVPRIF